MGLIRGKDSENAPRKISAQDLLDMGIRTRSVEEMRSIGATQVGPDRVPGYDVDRPIGHALEYILDASGKVISAGYHELFIAEREGSEGKAMFLIGTLGASAFVLNFPTAECKTFQISDNFDVKVRHNPLVDVAIRISSGGGDEVFDSKSNRVAFGPTTFFVINGKIYGETEYSAEEASMKPEEILVLRELRDEAKQFKHWESYKTFLSQKEYLNEALTTVSENSGRFEELRLELSYLLRSAAENYTAVMPAGTALFESMTKMSDGRTRITTESASNQAQLLINLAEAAEDPHQTGENFKTLISEFRVS